MSEKNKSSKTSKSAKNKEIKEESVPSVSESSSAYKNSKNNVKDLAIALQNLRNKNRENDKFQATFKELKEEEYNILQLYGNEDNVKNEIKEKDNSLNFNDDIFEARTLKILEDVYCLKEYILYPYFTIEYSPKKKSNVFKIYYYRFNIECGIVNQSDKNENPPQNDKKMKKNNNNSNEIMAFNFLDDRKTYMLSFKNIPMIFQKDNEGFISVTIISNNFESSNEFMFGKKGNLYETSFNFADISKELSEMRGIMTKTQNQKDSTIDELKKIGLENELNSIKKMYKFLTIKYSAKNITEELNKKKKELEYYEERHKYEINRDNINDAKVYEEKKILIIKEIEEYEMLLKTITIKIERLDQEFDGLFFSQNEITLENNLGEKLVIPAKKPIIVEVKNHCKYKEIINNIGRKKRLLESLNLDNGDNFYYIGILRGINNIKETKVIIEKKRDNEKLKNVIIIYPVNSNFLNIPLYEKKKEEYKDQRIDQLIAEMKEMKNTLNTLVKRSYNTNNLNTDIKEDKK